MKRLPDRGREPVDNSDKIGEVLALPAKAGKKLALEAQCPFLVLRKLSYVSRYSI
jgi:hypothetical protein